MKLSVDPVFHPFCQSTGGVGWDLHNAAVIYFYDPLLAAGPQCKIYTCGHRFYITLEITHAQALSKTSCSSCVVDLRENGRPICVASAICLLSAFYVRSTLLPARVLLGMHACCSLLGFLCTYVS